VLLSTANKDSFIHSFIHSFIPISGKSEAEARDGRRNRQIQPDRVQHLMRSLGSPA